MGSRFFTYPAESAFAGADGLPAIQPQFTMATPGSIKRTPIPNFADGYYGPIAMHGLHNMMMSSQNVSNLYYTNGPQEWRPRRQ